MNMKLSVASVVLLTLALVGCEAPPEQKKWGEGKGGLELADPEPPKEADEAPQPDATPSSGLELADPAKSKETKADSPAK